MNFKPYPILALKTGKQTNFEPWLLPKDAFKSLINWRIRNGVLEKRKGYEKFGRFVHTNTATAADTNPGNAVMGIKNYLNDGDYTLLAMDTKRVNKYDTGTSAFIDLTRKKIHVIPVSGQNTTPVAGDIVEGVTSGAYGTVESLITDYGDFIAKTAHGTIVFVNGSITGTFVTGEQLRDKNTPANIFGASDGAASDQEFTGDDLDYFRLTNWINKGYITNNNDQIQKYDGTALSRLYIDLDDEGGYANDVNSCKFIFVYRGHLILLSTVEGDSYTRRVRYSQVDNPQIWPALNYNDNNDTGDSITAAEFLGDDLIVWFGRRTYKLVYTTDSDVPFAWQKITVAENKSVSEGCNAPHSIVSLGNSLLCIGFTRIVATDGRDETPIDNKIPDEMLGWNQSAIEYSNGFALTEEKEVWWSYVSSAVDKPDGVLVYNYEDGSFTNFTLTDVHCFGDTTLESSLVLDDLADSILLDDITYSFDDKSLQAGYPLSLMGDRNGYIFRLNIGGNDDGAVIEATARGGRWNPYIEQGQKAELGWLDFLVDTNSNITITIRDYIDTDSAITVSKEFVCDGNALEDEKVWKRVYINAIGAFHNISIVNDESDSPRIHAIIPYFRPVGRALSTY